MKTIKFKGQRIDTKEWVEGYFVKDPKGSCRIYLQPFLEATSNTYYFVIPETVSQFTGLKDKNGKEIWETNKLSAFGTVITVEYYRGSFGYFTAKGKAWQEFHALATHNHLKFNGDQILNIEIIDNPDLLK